MESKIYADALAKPTADYGRLRTAKIRMDDAELIDMYDTGITNAQSPKFAIGTASLGPCCAVILYNKDTQTGVLTHQANPDAALFRDMLEQVRSDDSQSVELHIVGGLLYTPQSCPEYKELNENIAKQLNSVLAEAAKHKNVKLKTFDVQQKPKPNAVLLDTRDGKLIQGSELVITQEEGDKCEQYFGNLETLYTEHEISGPGHLFDGRKLERQKTR